MSAFGKSSDPSIAASDPFLSAWVAANAGAGKTYTLANRVTRLLLADVPPERILCLTFTKAAAAEMSNRLFTQLGKWSMLPDTELEANITNIGGELRERGGLRKARLLFAKALETPGGLKIQTIHAFCQNVLSRFPIEAGIPPFFRVLDDQTARELIAQARAQMLEEAGSGNNELAAAISYLVTETNSLDQVLSAALSNDRRKLERFFAKAEREHRTALLREAHGVGADDTPESVTDDFCSGLRNEIEKVRAVTEWLGGGTKTDIERSVLFSGVLAANAGNQSFDIFEEIFLTEKGERRARLATKNLATARPDLLHFLEGLADRFCAVDERKRGARAAKLADAALTVIDTVRRNYATSKRKRAVLDYDDLIAETRNLLEKRDAAAWVLYKLDGGIDHLLIDEAQDTSPEQWAIVRKLTEEFFSGNVAPETPRTIFAVGDEKQSIFSFQGADPAQFDINRRRFLESAADSDQPFNDERMPLSRRSAPEILTFVDKVFEDEAARSGLTSDDAPIRHEAFRHTAKGRVEFWPSVKPLKIPEPDWWRPVDVPSEASAITRLAERVADQIRELTRGDRSLPGHEQPITPGDIMILLPRREPFGSEIIRQLKARNVPVAGADRIRLTGQIAVMDLLALGRFAIQQDDDLNLASLLRSPLINLPEERLFDLAYPRAATLWSELQKRQGESPDFAHAHTFLSAILARADFAAPYEFYAHALVAQGLRQALLARLGGEAADAVEEFLSLALTYEQENTPSLEGFLHWIERGGAEIKRDMEQGRGEVRVMTVHGAKGLEADIVFLPDTTSLPEQPARKGHLLHTQDAVLFPVTGPKAPQAVKTAKDAARIETLKEHRRLLYVALTRAKERLYICGFENRKGIDPESWYALSQRAALALGTEEPRGEETVLVYGNGVDVAGTLPLASVLQTPQIPKWATQPPPPEPPAPRLIRPSDAAGAEGPTLSPVANAQRFQRGVWVHALLAHLPELPQPTRQDIALRFLKNHKLSSGDALALATEVMNILNDSIFTPAFIPGSKAEIAIAADLPELGPGQRVQGRIDRLTVTDEEVLILDYKTNSPPPRTEKDVPQLYLTQMALYRAAATRIFPGKRISCGLIWTDAPSLMPLSPTLLDSQIERIRSRLADQGTNT